VSVKGAVIDSQSDWDKALAAGRVGQPVEIRFLQRGRERRSTMTLRADPTVEIVRNEAIGKAITPAERAFRDSWLGGEAPAAN
jgi:predicted metalloprotease with PDZ domain